LPELLFLIFFVFYDQTLFVRVHGAHLPFVRRVFYVFLLLVEDFTSHRPAEHMRISLLLVSAFAKSKRKHLLQLTSRVKQ